MLLIDTENFIYIIPTTIHTIKITRVEKYLLQIHFKDK